MKAYRNSNHGMEFSHCMLLKFDDSEVSGTLFFTAVFFNEDIFIPCASHDFLVGLAFMSFPVDWRWSRQWMDTDSLLKLPSFWLQYIPCSFFYCCRWRVSRVFIPRRCRWSSWGHGMRSLKTEKVSWLMRHLSHVVLISKEKQHPRDAFSSIFFTNLNRECRVP